MEEAAVAGEPAALGRRRLVDLVGEPRGDLGEPPGDSEVTRRAARAVRTMAVSA
jgi:hypothetical protein